MNYYEKKEVERLPFFMQRKEVRLMGKLTEKQQRFVEEYLIDLNATQAAIRAGYSVKTADQQGSRLLTIVKVQEEITKAMAERSRRTGINQDRVLQELARIAFVNPQNIINTSDGSVNPNATEDDLACIQSVKVKTVDGEKSSSEEREIKLNDKMKALELLGRHLGMFKDKVEVSGITEEKNKLDDILSQMRGGG